jgi:hypothetical protein
MANGATVRRLGEIAPVAAHRGSRTKTSNGAPAGVQVDSTVGNSPMRSFTEISGPITGYVLGNGNCPGKQLREDAGVAALKGRNNGEISFCKTLTWTSHLFHNEE